MAGQSLGKRPMNGSSPLFSTIERKNVTTFDRFLIVGFLMVPILFPPALGPLQFIVIFGSLCAAVYVLQPLWDRFVLWARRVNSEDGD